MSQYGSGCERRPVCVSGRVKLAALFCCESAVRVQTSNLPLSTPFASTDLDQRLYSTHPYNTISISLSGLVVDNRLALKAPAPVDKPVA